MSDFIYTYMHTCSYMQITGSDVLILKILSLVFVNLDCMFSFSVLIFVSLGIKYILMNQLTTAVHQFSSQSCTSLHSKCWLGLQSCEGLNRIGESSLMAARSVLAVGKKLQYFLHGSQSCSCVLMLQILASTRRII